MLKSFLLFTAVVLLVLASASAPARPPQESNQAAAKKATPDGMSKAKKVYELDCAMCHGANGDAKTDLAKDMQLSLLDWSDPKTLAGKSDQQLFDAIRKGSGKMPPEDDSRAKNDEVHNLVTYIRRFAKDQPAAAAPATEEPTAAPAPTTPPPATAPSN